MMNAVSLSVRLIAETKRPPRLPPQLRGGDKKRGCMRDRTAAFCYPMCADAPSMTHKSVTLRLGCGAVGRALYSLQVLAVETLGLAR